MTPAPDLDSTADAGTADRCAPGAPATECCSLSGGPMGHDDARRVAGLLKALADPTRLRLLSHVAAQGCDTVCVCSLTDDLGISQPTVSHHLSELVTAGLLTRQQRGKWAWFQAVPDALASIRTALGEGAKPAETGATTSCTTCGPQAAELAGRSARA